MEQNQSPVGLAPTVRSPLSASCWTPGYSKQHRHRHPRSRLGPSTNSSRTGTNMEKDSFPADKAGIMDKGGREAIPDLIMFRRRADGKPGSAVQSFASMARKIKSGDHLDRIPESVTSRTDSAADSKRPSSGPRAVRGTRQEAQAVQMSDSGDSTDGENRDDEQNVMVLPRAYDVGIKAASFKKWPAQKGIRNKWLLAHEGAPSKVLITAPPGLADALPLCEFDKLEDFAGCSRLNCLFACRMQQNTPAKRLEIIMSSRAKAQSAGVTNEPRQLAPATSDAAEDLEAMQTLLGTDSTGWTLWEQRNRYLESWCKMQGIKPHFEAVGPDDVGAVDAIIDRLPASIKGNVDRKQVVNVLWPAGKRRHRGQRGQFSRPVSNAGSDDDQSDFSEEEDLFRALSLERMQLSLPRILTPHKRPVNFSTGPGRNALPSDPNKKDAEEHIVTLQQVTFTKQDIKRLERRISPDRTAMNFSHYLYGHDQVYAVQHLLTIHTQLQSLALANNDLRDSEVEMLASTLKTLRCCLSVLNLSNNCLSYHTLDALVPFLKQKSAPSNRQVKNASRLNPASKKLESVARLAKMAAPASEDCPSGSMPRCPPVLSELYLSGNPIGNKAMKTLHLNVIGRGVELTVLDISNCKITSHGALHLAEFIVANRSLIELKIGWNGLGAKGCRAVADALQGSPTIKKLDMSWCGMGEVGGADIMGVLRSNTVLRQLDLTGNNLGDLAAVELGRALEMNRSLKHVILKHNPIGWQGARKLLRATLGDHIETIDLSHCHLLHRPCGASEFDPRYPWGEYILDLAVAAERVVAIQLADLTQPPDSLVIPEWVNATIDGEPFRLESTLEDEGSHWNLPKKGLLQVTVIRQGLPDFLKDEPPISDSVLKTMWSRSISGDENVTDEWKLALLDILCVDYYFTVEQLLAIMRAFALPREKVRAVLKVFARLSDLENFHVVEDSLPAPSLDNLHETLGLSRKFNSKNPTGHYDLVLSSQVDNAIAWRLLDEFRRQNRMGLCRLTASGLRVTCWAQATFNGEPLFIDNPDSYRVPSTGLLSLTFVDLEPAPACAEPLDEFRFRAMLGYLAEVSPLDPKLMADFVTDPELQWLATVRYGLSNSMLQGDLPGSVRGIKDLENLLHALRSVSYRFLGPGIVVEVACIFWSRCTDRKDWAFVLSSLSDEAQVRFCHLVGYCTILNPFNPNLHYQLRLFKPDELYVLTVLHDIAQASNVRMPYSNAYVKYPEVDDWVPLKEAIEKRGREWNKGLKSVWEAFVDGIRDVHATKVPTIVEFDFQISSEEKDHAAACFIQRTWRAWKEQNTYLKLQVSVAIIKTRMLQMAAKRILAELDRTSDDSSSAHKRIINALRDVMRDASFHLAYLKTDPTGMLKSARAIESAKRIRREHKAALQIEMLAPGATSVRSRRAAISQRRFSLKTRHVSEPPGTSIREGAKDQANPLDQPDTLRGGKRRQRPQLILTQNPQEGTSSMAEARGMTSFQVKNTLSSGGLADERSMWEQARWRLGVTSLTVASITALLYEDD